MESRFAGDGPARGCDHQGIPHTHTPQTQDHGPWHTQMPWPWWGGNPSGGNLKNKTIKYCIVFRCGWFTCCLPKFQTLYTGQLWLTWGGLEPKAWNYIYPCTSFSEANMWVPYKGELCFLTRQKVASHTTVISLSTWKRNIYSNPGFVC